MGAFTGNEPIMDEKLESKELEKQEKKIEDADNLLARNGKKENAEIADRAGAVCLKNRKRAKKPN